MSQSLRRIVGVFGLFAFVMVASHITAKADGVLTNQGPVQQSGTGFGAVVNILTLQLTGGGGPMEAGSVTPSGLTGDAKNTSQCATVLALTNEGINANNLAFVFNINQTGGDPLVHLDEFTVNFYDDEGVLLFSADTEAGSLIEYSVVNQGTGGAGFLFTLTGIDQMTLEEFFANPDNCIGAVATVSDGVDDGPENFYATRTNAVEPVPEPTTMSLLGLGLLGVASMIRRRRAGK